VPDPVFSDGDSLQGKAVSLSHTDGTLENLTAQVDSRSNGH